MTTLVTGASRGVGRAVARMLIARGEEVIGVHLRESPSSVAFLQECGPALTLHRVDLTQAEGLAVLMEALARGPALRGAVLNAGVAERRLFVEGNGEDDPIRRQLRADLEAPLVLLRGLLQRAVLKAPASVVFTGSNLARRGLSHKVAYSAAKAGIEAATRGLAHELGPEGIRVNTVAPGLLRTDMTADATAKGTEARYAAYAQEVPLRRVGTPEDAAAAIGFLLGADADYITGQTLDVDGGWGC